MTRNTSTLLKTRWAFLNRYQHLIAALIISILFGVLQTGLLAQSSQKPLIENVSPEDVKKFLDPTIMYNVLEYRFQANFLRQNTKLFSRRPYVGYSLNHWSAVWAEVPYWHFSSPGTAAPSGISDTLIGGGVVPYKDLSKRVT